MQRNYKNTFEYGRKMAKTLMIATFICSLIPVFLLSGNPMAQNIMIVVTVCLFIGTIYTIYKYCVCPHCGKHIVAGLLVVKSCPRCRRNLETGRKMKK